MVKREMVRYGHSVKVVALAEPAVPALFILIAEVYHSIYIKETLIVDLFSQIWSC